jgi:hypothetical protein
MVHSLLRGRALRDHPERLYVDDPMRTYIDSIDQFINKHNLHNSVPPSRGKHIYRETYNCLIRNPSKPNTVRVNQVTGNVQFGDNPWWNGHMYHNKVDQLKIISNSHNFQLISFHFRTILLQCIAIIQDYFTSSLDRAYVR